MKLPSPESVTAAPALHMPRFQTFEQPADDLDMETCMCGARLPEAAAWCPVCLKVPVDRDALLDELHDTFRKTTWDPPKELIAPPPPKRFSRWEATVLTFGPRLKLAVTAIIGSLEILTLLMFQPWYLFSHSDEGYHPARAFALFAVVLVSGLCGAALRLLWRKGRVE